MTTQPVVPPSGELLLHSSFNFLSNPFPWRSHTQVELNGHRMPVQWGQWPIPLQAGDYHLRVSSVHFNTMHGPADLPITIRPGGTTAVYYRSPFLVGFRGSIGFVPQMSRGVWLLLACMALGMVGLVLVLSLS